MNDKNYQYLIGFKGQDEFTFKFNTEDLSVNCVVEGVERSVFVNCEYDGYIIAADFEYPLLFTLELDNAKRVQFKSAYGPEDGIDGKYVQLQEIYGQEGDDRRWDTLNEVTLDRGIPFLARLMIEVPIPAAA